MGYYLIMNQAIAKVYSVGNYTISETDTKRDVDFRRFNVSKDGARKPYVVTFQTNTGRKAACSCPAGIRQLGCKHVVMVKSVYA